MEVYSRLRDQLGPKAPEWYALRKKVQMVNPPYLRGKIALIGGPYDDGSGPAHVDISDFDVPDDLRPASTQDVGTVILTTRTTRDIGVYKSLSGGANYEIAFKATLTIQIIDLSIPAVIGVKSFKSPDPPKQFDPKFFPTTITNNQMWDYLRTLERK
jgi:hypothetical protein